jgi:hypothetical protein
MTTNLLVIEDKVIREMVRDPRFSHLSCVQSYNSRIASEKQKCGRCKRKLKNAQGAAYQELANCLSRLPPQSRNEVKQLLGARQLRTIRTNSKGQRVQITF